MTKKLATLIFFIIAAALVAGCGPSPPPNVVHSVEDLSGRHIGALSGTPSERLANEHGIAWGFESGEELINHLLLGSIDAAIMESTTAAELISGTRGVRVLGESLLVFDLRFAIALENTGLLLAVDDALNTLRNNGTLRGFNDYFFANRRFTYNPPQGITRRPGYLSIAVSSDNPPFSFVNEEGLMTGLDIAVARAVSDLLGVDLRVIEYNSWELIRAVRYGRADLAMGWLPGEGDDTLINISEPYSTAVQVVITRR